MSEIANYKNLIGGSLQPAASGKLIDSINPATGQVWARIPASDRSDADAAVAAAAAAFPSWSALPSSVRSMYLERIAKLFVQHGEELARLESTDNGNPIGVSQFMCGLAMEVLWKRAAGEVIPAITGRTAVLDAETFGFTRREPYGVIAVIIPFNMPIAMFSNKVALALAAGNTVVAKPPEQASVGVLRLTELIADVLPPGVVNVISGLGEVGDLLVRNPKVAKVTMTGSPGTAKIIQKATAETLTPSIFELGGKSPNIVFADADLTAASYGVTTQSIYTFNAGQACVGGSRILIQRPVLKEMLERIRAIAEEIVIGDPLDPATTMGPIISQRQLDRIAGYLDAGRKEAELVFGGRHGPVVASHLPGGYWVEPTLFMTTNNSLSICRDEIFGPVAVVIPFDTDDEAVAIANDSRYGLASGVWTQSLPRVHRMVRDIQAGTVWVNTYMQFRPELPFEGIKESGYGQDTILQYTREKAAVISMAPPLPPSRASSPGVGI